MSKGYDCAGHRPDHLKCHGCSDRQWRSIRKGRDFSAWIGLVPKQMSTGDRTILGRVSSGATVTCARSSCKQPGSFCYGRQAGRSTASGSGSRAPLSASIPTFRPQLSPTSWHGSPGRCWPKSAVMKRASRRRQPETLKFTRECAAANLSLIGVGNCTSLAADRPRISPCPRPSGAPKRNLWNAFGLVNRPMRRPPGCAAKWRWQRGNTACAHRAWLRRRAPPPIHRAAAATLPRRLHRTKVTACARQA